MSAPSSVTAHKREGYWRLLGEVEGCCLVLGVVGRAFCDSPDVPS